MHIPFQLGYLIYLSCLLLSCNIEEIKISEICFSQKVEMQRYRNLFLWLKLPEDIDRIKQEGMET